MLKVCKFGGSSLADAAEFLRVRDLVAADVARRVVVVSAPGRRHLDDQKITDLLYLCHAHLRYGVPCWELWRRVCDRFLAIRDGCGELLQAYLRCDAAIFLAGTALGFVDYRMKNVIDRLLPLATMYIHIVDGECRHVPRYDHKLRFGLLYAGAADGAYLGRWMERVMRNLGGESLGAYPIEAAGEVFACI